MQMTELRFVCQLMTQRAVSEPVMAVITGKKQDLSPVFAIIKSLLASCVLPCSYTYQMIWCKFVKKELSTSFQLSVEHQGRIATPKSKWHEGRQ